MPTILDELIVKIGLDGSAFKTQVAQTQTALTRVGASARGEAKALEEYLKKTQEETGSRIKQVQEVGRQASQQFTSMKNHVLGLLGAIAGAYGLESFFKSIVSGDASLGAFSKTLGISTEQLATWIEMGKRAGVSADAVKQAFVAINQIQQDILLHGTSAATPMLNAMGLDPMDEMRRPKETIAFLKEIGEWAKNHPPEQLRAVFGAIGLPPEMIPLLNQGREGLEKLEQAMRAQGVATAKSAEEDQRLLNQFSDLEQIIRDIGRSILSDMMPALTAAVMAMRDWFMANKDWIEQDIGRFIRVAIETIKDLAPRIDEVVKALGGWKVVAEALVVIWGATKVAPLLTFLTTFTGMVLTATGAVTSLGTSMAALSMPAWFASLLRLGAFGAAAMAFTGGAGGEDDEFSRQKNDEFLRRGGSFLGGMGGASDARLASVRDKLANDPRLGISRNAASGLASNLNAESGIRGINEANGGPGFGWAQWTNTQGSPRRTNFETFAAGKGLDPSSDAANYEFLVEELRTKYPQILSQLRRGDISASDAAGIVARGYIVPPADKIPGHVADAERVSKLPVPPIPPTGPVFGPQLPAIDPSLSSAIKPLAPVSNDNSRTSSVETHINGPINVQTAATDTDGIARGIGESLRKYAYVPQVNTGLA